MNSHLLSTSCPEVCSSCARAADPGRTVHSASCLVSTALPLTTTWEMAELHTNSPVKAGGGDGTASKAIPLLRISGLQCVAQISHSQ